MPEQTGSSLVFFLPLAAMFAAMYFLVWRPQSRQQKQRREMLESLRKGDKVVTIGGIRGVVTGLKEDAVTVRVADKLELELDRSGIGYVRGKG
ncbi:MAG: preprotein translocase subunit YajC [bacterium]|nr:preprotein translocase subunit YajC [bacterium]